MALVLVAVAVSGWVPTVERGGLAVLDSETPDVFRVAGTTLAYQGKGSVLRIGARAVELGWEEGSVTVRPKHPESTVEVRTPHGTGYAVGPMVVTVSPGLTRYESSGHGLRATCTGTLGRTLEPTEDGDALVCPPTPR